MRGRPLYFVSVIVERIIIDNFPIFHSKNICCIGPYCYESITSTDYRLCNCPSNNRRRQLVIMENAF